MGGKQHSERQAAQCEASSTVRGEQHSVHSIVGGVEATGSVDAAHPLCKHGVRNQLGELSGPNIGTTDLLLRHPLLVDACKQGHSFLAICVTSASDQHSIWKCQILDCCALVSQMSQQHDQKCAHEVFSGSI